MIIRNLVSNLGWAKDIKKSELVKQVCVSSLSKPFVILTGGSGSGKSAIAKSLAYHLQHTPVSNDRTLLKIGDVIGESYTVVGLTDELLTLRNPKSSILPLPKAIVQEWLDAWDAGEISENKKVRENRTIVKGHSEFDPQCHSWESHLTALAKSGKGFKKCLSVQTFVIVPVGSDWTDNRNVLGFVNHLHTNGDKPVFQSTPVLDLIFEANNNKDLPFFLILDEMNLSHVERYFADFLSVMEQRDGELTLHSEGPRDDENFRLPRYENDPVGVPRTLPYPQNLFVIGTVNVDETTYMFSPKVLDRANVIEFEVESDQISDFLSAPHEYPESPKAEDGVAEAFLALARKSRLDPGNGGLDALGGPVAEGVQEHLVALFEILKRGRFEFAYRTANEVMRYLRVCRYLAAEESDEARDAWDNGGWRDDLDVQIVQKILPKLHGSMGRVGHLLGALAAYCGGATEDAAFAYFPGGKDGANPAVTGLPLSEALKPVTDGAHEFSKSRRKLVSMIQVLLEEQFVSFIN